MDNSTSPCKQVLTASFFDQTLDCATRSLARAGDWLSGEQRLNAWQLVRQPGETTPLPDDAAEVVRSITLDPGRRTLSWAKPLIASLTAGVYTELVGVAAIAKVVDTADRALGRAQRSLPSAESGSPAKVRPEGVGDVGAWVPQALQKTRANVSRTLSLVPETNKVWWSLVDPLYSRGDEFVDLTWKRPLPRPHVELIAARTTVLQQCFY